MLSSRQIIIRPGAYFQGLRRDAFARRAKGRAHLQLFLFGLAGRGNFLPADRRLAVVLGQRAGPLQADAV